MTETVQVPVDLLKKLANSYHNYSDHDPYAVTSAMPSHVVGLVSLIPEPVKVGDKIKGAAFAALPPLSVAIDFEGDVWVRTAPGDAALIASDGIAPAYYSVQADDYMAVDFSEGTVVHIGEEVN